MRGNFDDTFFDQINEVFICLVVSAMRHCLKAWRTGVFVETQEFKYETTISKLIYTTSDVENDSTDTRRHIQEIPSNLGITPSPSSSTTPGYDKSGYTK